MLPSRARAGGEARIVELAPVEPPFEPSKRAGVGPAGVRADRAVRVDRGRGARPGGFGLRRPLEVPAGRGDAEAGPTFNGPPRYPILKASVTAAAGEPVSAGEAAGSRSGPRFARAVATRRSVDAGLGGRRGAVPVDDDPGPPLSDPCGVREMDCPGSSRCPRGPDQCWEGRLSTPRWGRVRRKCSQATRRSRSDSARWLHGRHAIVRGYDSCQESLHPGD